MPNVTHEIYYLTHTAAKPIGEPFEVAGIPFRRRSMRRAMKGKQVRVYLKRDPRNKNDKNAIKVMLTCRRWGFWWHHHVGFIPRELAAELVDQVKIPYLIPKPADAWIGTKGGVGLTLQLML